MNMSQDEELTSRVERLLDAVRQSLASNKCAVARRQTLKPRQFAAAGLAHACVLLERMDAERRSGDDLVVRIIARAHYETWLISMYLLLGGEEAYQHLRGAHRRGLRIQHDLIASYNAKIRRERQRVAKANLKIRKNNDRIRIVNDTTDRDIPLLTELPEPEGKEISYDLTGILSSLADASEADLSFREIAERIGPLAEQQGKSGGHWGSNYDLIYRGLSGMGSHPTFWVLDKYLQDGGYFVHVASKALCAPLAETAVRSAIGMTAILAADVLDAFHADSSYPHQVADEWVSSRGFG